MIKAGDVSGQCFFVITPINDKLSGQFPDINLADVREWIKNFGG